MIALFGYVTALLKYFDLVLSNIGQLMNHSLGAPLGFYKLHRNAYVIVGVTSFLRENDEKLPVGF